MLNTRIVVARAGGRNSGLPMALLNDPQVITAAAYPLPIFGDNDEPLGRVLSLVEQDGVLYADAELFHEEVPAFTHINYVEIDVKHQDGRRIITSAVLDSLTAASPTPPPPPASPPAGGGGSPDTPPVDDTGEPTDDPNITVDTELPIAPLDTAWDPHTATARMLANANTGGTVDAELLGNGFLYQDPGSDGTSVADYQFPVADVLSGTLTIVPNALLDAASVIDAGGPATDHISDADMQALSDVLDELYTLVAGDSGSTDTPMDSGCATCGDNAMVAAATADLPIAPESTTWDGSAAESRVLKWATGADGTVNGTKLGTAYLYQTPGSDPTLQASYKLPVADVINGTLMVVPAAVRAAAASLGGARTALKGLTPAAKKTARAVVDKLMAKVRAAGKSSSTPAKPTPPTPPTKPVTASAATGWRRHLRPPEAFFAPLNLSGPTPITVTPDGEVFGHCGDWSTCHRSFVASGICIPPPRSTCDYCHYNLGTVYTAEGNPINVGAYSVGGGHASLDLGMAAATAHYDNIAAVPAIGVMREDEHGPYFHGALTPQATDEQIYSMLAFPPSGDWREERPGTGLEMIAVTSVATPGFAVKANLTAAGEVSALIIPRQGGYAVTTSENADILTEVAALRDQAVAVLAASIGRTRADELLALSNLIHVTEYATLNEQSRR